MEINQHISAQVTGHVVDENKQPVSYATIALLALPDSSLVSGTISNEQGYYKLDKSCH